MTYTELYILKKKKTNKQTKTNKQQQKINKYTKWERNRSFQETNKNGKW